MQDPYEENYKTLLKSSKSKDLKEGLNKISG